MIIYSYKQMYELSLKVSKENNKLENMILI